MGNRKNYLTVAPLANPAMTKMFDAPTGPESPSHLLPWSGEFAGKYLIAAVQDLRMTKDMLLHQTVSEVVRDLIRYQRANGGYLGAYAPPDRIFGQNWDAWNHYHCLLGLLEWSRYAGDGQALDACCAIADYLCIRFSEPEALARLHEPEKNFALSHVMALLYRQTGRPNYLTLLRSFEEAWTTVRGGGDYVNNFSQPISMWSLYGGGDRGARWERLHGIQTLAELYRIGKDARYRRAFQNAWEGMRRFDRHVGGGFSSVEVATGNPFDPRPIETCGTVGWMTLTADLLRLTGDASAADELELSTWNAALGGQSPDGSWWTYDTPMGGIDTAGMQALPLHYPCNRPPSFAGERHPSRYALGWQDRAGASFLSCCAANGPRSLGLLSEWAFMETDEGVVVNFYGPCRVTMTLANGNLIELEQVTEFPRSGQVTVRMSASQPEPLTLTLRIPGWSERTTVSVGGDSQPVTAGTYHGVRRDRWDGEVVELRFDMAVRPILGDPRRDGADPNSGLGATGRVALYRGPVLLAFDERDNPWPVEAIPALGGGPVEVTILGPEEARPGPMLVGRATTATTAITMCDFATAGMPKLAPVGIPDLVGRVFQFGRSDRVLAERLHLAAGGKVVGYIHPNEAWWGWEGTTLVLGAAEGNITTRFAWSTRENGMYVLRGKSEVDPTIVHELREVDLSLEGKWFQFSRVGGEVLAERVQLLGDGTISGYSHPNERRWQPDGDVFEFVSEEGRVTTRFGKTRSRFGRVDYEGVSNIDPARTHRLSELDLGVLDKEWQFLRPNKGPISMRLLRDGRIHSDNPDESRWAMEDATLVFYGADGAATTRFTKLTKDPMEGNNNGRMLWIGTYLPLPSIEHKLREWNADLEWKHGLRYVTWLPS